MAGMDASSARPQPNPAGVRSIANLTDPAEKMQALGRWLGGRIEALAEAEIRIDKRLEHLARTEESLKGLFDDLRRQVASAYPVLEQLRQIKPTAQAAVEEVAGEVRRRVEDAVEQLRSVTPPPIPDLEPAALGPSIDLERIESEAREIEQRTLATIRSAEAAMEERSAVLEARIADADQTAGQIASLLEEHGQQVLEQTRSAIEQLAEPVRRRLECAAGPAEDALREVVESFHRRAGDVLLLARRTLDERLEELVSQIALRADPLVSRIRAEQILAATELRREVERSITTIHQHADHVRLCAERVIESFEERLATRVLSLKPRAAEALDATERQVLRRSEALLRQVDEQLAAGEAALTDRLSRLRPALLAELASLKAQLDGSARDLERQTEALAAWLEQRLSDRTGRLVQELRGKLARELPPSAADEPVAGPSVEVEVYVDRNRAGRATGAPGVYPRPRQLAG